VVVEVVVVEVVVVGGRFVQGVVGGGPPHIHQRFPNAALSLTTVAVRPTDVAFVPSPGAPVS
jgi:hypothetical protein